MRPDRAHATDEELVRLADGELDERRAAEVRAHLTACWACRSTAHALDQAVDRFVRAHRGTLDVRIPPDAGPRAALLAALAAEAPPRREFRGGLRRFLASRLAWSTGGLAALLALALLALPTLPWSADSGQLAAYEVPDASLTPGWTVAESHDVLCSGQPEHDPPLVARPVALAIFERYGIDDPAPRAYEVDYLIAPELGGSTDVRNLWPQSYAGTWNAHLKDALEEHLHRLVCRGEVALDVAQREIARDWVAAYRKRDFQTDIPLESHQTFLKDRPWQ